jgi:hypothetical protein
MELAKFFEKQLKTLMSNLGNHIGNFIMWNDVKNKNKSNLKIKIKIKIKSKNLLIKQNYFLAPCPSSLE